MLADFIPLESDTLAGVAEVGFMTGAGQYQKLISFGEAASPSEYLSLSGGENIEFHENQPVGTVD